MWAKSHDPGSRAVPRDAVTERAVGGSGAISGPALVGRARELAALDRVFAAPPAVVAVEGEPGIGKTRLISEFLQTAAAPAPFLLASCPPYREPHTLGAVVDAVRQAAPDPARLPRGQLAGALRSLFPEWAGLLPAAEPAEDASAARHRLFHALAELLRWLDIALLAVEDAHWADDATVEFLLFLASRRPQPLSLMVSYRAEDLSADSMVTRLLSRLPGSGHALRLTLGPLDVGETSELVSSMLAGEHVSAGYAAFVHRHTDGVPLAIEESVRLMHERADLIRRGESWMRRPLRGIEVPPTVRDVVLERVQRLPADALAVLQAAAVLAEPAAEQLLLAVAGLPGERGRAGLAATLGARLLHEDQTGLASFRHSLSGRAIYEAIPASHRRTLHRLAGQALQDASPPPLAQLARHFRGAGDILNWARYGEQAADAALASGDEATAGAILYDLLTSASLAPPAMARIAAKLPLGAFSGPARYHAMISALRAVLAGAGMSRATEAALRYHLGRALMMTGEFGESLGELRRSIPHLADGGSKERALVMLAWRSSTSPTWIRRRWLSRAAAVAVPAASPGERLRLLTDRVTTMLTLGEEEGWQLAGQLPATAASAAERLQLARAWLNLGVLAMVWGRYAEAGAWLEDALGLSERYGYSRVHEAILATQAHLDWFTGAWAGLAGRAVAMTASSDLDLVTRIEAALVTGLLEIATARSEAGARLSGALASVRESGPAELTMEYVAALARLHLGEQRPDQALTVTDEASDMLGRTGTWVWATDLVPARVQALVTAGRAAEASKLTAAYSRGLAGRDAPAPAAALVLCRAIVAAARGQHGRAAGLFGGAAAAWRDLPRPYDAALAAERQGGCLVATGQLTGGTALLSQAHAELTGLGAAADADRIAHALRGHGVTVPRAWSGGRRGYGDHLSPREVEVVRLVAAGRTNREIAAALYRSPPTVATQLRSAMRKLGASSRAALAVRAMETGVLPASDRRPGG
jgi:DNA-binding CsgD family transcriptional regulator/tetratricopeptide (TPR) repeat protein